MWDDRTMRMGTPRMGMSKEIPSRKEARDKGCGWERKGVWRKREPGRSGCRWGIPEWGEKAKGGTGWLQHTGHA